MRTVPKSRAKFQEMVNERGARLRRLPFEDLKQLSVPTEKLIIDSRPATIDIIVQEVPSSGVRVVVQGFLKARFLGSHVALDGFYKYPDETLALMPVDEFYEFD